MASCAAQVLGWEKAACEHPANPLVSALPQGTPPPGPGPPLTSLLALVSSIQENFSVEPPTTSPPPQHFAGVAYAGHPMG